EDQRGSSSSSGRTGNAGFGGGPSETPTAGTKRICINSFRIELGQIPLTIGTEGSQGSRGARHHRRAKVAAPCCEMRPAPRRRERAGCVRRHGTQGEVRLRRAEGRGPKHRGSEEGVFEKKGTNAS